MAEAAEKNETELQIPFDDEEADADSAMLIIAFGADKRAEVTVQGENADAVAEIAALIEQELDAGQHGLDVRPARNVCRQTGTSRARADQAL